VTVVVRLASALRHYAGGREADPAPPFPWVTTL
jgi:hypothetical protein